MGPWIHNHSCLPGQDMGESWEAGVGWKAFPSLQRLSALVWVAASSWQ